MGVGQRNGVGWGWPPGCPRAESTAFSRTGLVEAFGLAADELAPKRLNFLSQYDGLEAFGLAAGELAATAVRVGSGTSFVLRFACFAIFSFVRSGCVPAAGGDRFSGAGD